jgi:branched-chain amino acid transport system substrate-binding protein
MPDEIRYRAGDHQLMPNLYVGHAIEKGSAPEDFFAVDQVVRGVDVAPSVADTGCKVSYPL